MDSSRGLSIVKLRTVARTHEMFVAAVKSWTRQRDARPRRAYIKSVASVHKTWRERGEFRLDQLFHGRASALRALGILLSMSSNVTWSTSWYSVLPSTESRPACAAPLGVYRAWVGVHRPTDRWLRRRAINALPAFFLFLSLFRALVATFARCNRCIQDCRVRTRVLRARSYVRNMYILYNACKDRTLSLSYPFFLFTHSRLNNCTIV